MAKRRKYDKEFKLQAVKLVTEQGMSIAQVTRDLDIPNGNVSRWVQEFSKSEVDAFRGHGNLPPSEDEVRRLKKELKRVTMERDILKKAVGFFSKDQLD